jgi:hypothetical protein
MLRPYGTVVRQNQSGPSCRGCVLPMLALKKLEGNC